MVGLTVAGTDTQPDTADSTGTPPVLVDVRVGSRAGYDRVVREFVDGGTPDWRAEYVDDPARQRSGAAVELPGDATLAVTIQGVGAPGAWFEGYVGGFVGVTSE